MSNVYSTLFVRQFAATPGLYTYVVPDGQRAVVVSIDANCSPGTRNQRAALQGFFVQDSEDVTWWQVLPPDAVTNVQYHWEGRQVYNAGDVICFNALDGGWQFSLSGFLLTLP